MADSNSCYASGHVGEKTLYYCLQATIILYQNSNESAKYYMSYVIILQLMIYRKSLTTYAALSFPQTLAVLSCILRLKILLYNMNSLSKTITFLLIKGKQFSITVTYRILV